MAINSLGIGTKEKNLKRSALLLYQWHLVSIDIFLRTSDGGQYSSSQSKCMNGTRQSWHIPHLYMKQCTLLQINPSNSVCMFDCQLKQVVDKKVFKKMLRIHSCQLYSTLHLSTVHQLCAVLQCYL